MPEYGDYNRFEPKTQENITIPEKVDTSAANDENQVDPKTSVVSHAILNAPKKLPEEADSLVGRRLTKSSPEEVSGKANAVGTPILFQADEEGDAMDLLQQDEMYAKQKVDSQLASLDAESIPPKRDFASMNADELEAVLEQDLSEEEMNIVLQRLDELSAVLSEEAAQLDEEAVQFKEAAVQLDETAVQLNEEAVQLDEAAVQLNEASAEITEEAVQLDTAAVNIEEEKVELESNNEELQQMERERVADKVEAKEVMDQKAEKVVVGEVREVAKNEEVSDASKKYMVIDQETGRLVQYNHDLHKDIPRAIVSLDEETGALKVMPGSEHLFKVGQWIDTPNGSILLKKIQAFTEEEIAQMEAFIAGQMNNIIADEKDSKKPTSYSASSPMRYKEGESSSLTSLQMRNNIPLGRERVSPSRDTYEHSSKKFLDEALAKNYKKIQEEHRRLEKEILAREILTEGIKRDQQTHSILKSTQQLQELQTKNQQLDAQYDAALQKFLDGMKGHEERIPLPLIKKIKEIQVEFVSLGTLIPKEVTGTKDMVKVMGQVVKMKKEVMTVMSGLITAAGKLYTSGGNSERQPTSKM